MKKLIIVIIVILLIPLCAVLMMALLNICPPQGPWPQPPWCEGSVYHLPFGIFEKPSTSNDQPQSEVTSSEQDLAWVAYGVMNDMAVVQGYFQEAASSMGQAGQGFKGSAMNTAYKIMAKPAYALQTSATGPPAGFTSPLPSNGYIPAPAGACAAGAAPSASFSTGNDETVTPELLEEIDATVIDYEALSGGDINGRALQTTIEGLIVPGDQRLATADGWNEMVWEPLKELQTPMDSLMDYHLWTVASDLEQMINDSMESRMETMGLPDVVLNAYEDSDHFGWYASKPATPEDRLTSMNIEAVFSGDLEGVIYEERDFSIPVLGEMPEFGPMTGYGSVTYVDSPFGPLELDVTLEWTGWDEMGRVKVGKAVMVNEEKGIFINFTFNEDGSKTGEVFINNEKQGDLQMSVDGTNTWLEYTGD